MIALVVTRGFGNGTFAGSVAKIITRGYDISSAVDIRAVHSLSGSFNDRQSLAGTFLDRRGLSGVFHDRKELP